MSMKEFKLAPGAAKQWFQVKQSSPYVLVEVSDADAQSWATVLGAPLRRAYVSDALLKRRAAESGEAPAVVVAAKLPDPGAVMSGDFGEFVTFIYLASSKASPIGPKKWRLKNDRTQPAPLSDVVQFLVPSWPTPSVNDEVVCAEVKAKATSGSSKPISSAIAGAAKDRTSRLGKTLAWLRDRAVGEDLGETSIKLIDRFLASTGQPTFTKTFFAVAVLCDSVAAKELKSAPATAGSTYSLVVIKIPKLKSVYESVFVAAKAAT